MSAWLADGLPPRLPANSSRACGPASARMRSIDQRVVHDDVGLGEPGQRIEREQARIARPGAGEPDMARLEDRNAGALRRQGVPGRHDAIPS